MRAAKTREKAEAQELRPVITRQPHSPIESLGITAVHRKISSEGTYGNPARADFACRVSANAAQYHLDAVPRRFLKLLEAAA